MPTSSFAPTSSVPACGVCRAHDQRRLRVRAPVLLDEVVHVLPVEVRVGEVAVRVHAAADQLVEVRDGVRVVGERRDHRPSREDPRAAAAPRAVRDRRRSEHEQEGERGQDVADAELRIDDRAEEGDARWPAAREVHEVPPRRPGGRRGRGARRSPAASSAAASAGTRTSGRRGSARRGRSCCRGRGTGPPAGAASSRGRGRTCAGRAGAATTASRAGSPRCATRTCPRRGRCRRRRRRR